MSCIERWLVIQQTRATTYDCPRNPMTLHSLLATLNTEYDCWDSMPVRNLHFLNTICAVRMVVGQQHRKHRTHVTLTSDTLVSQSAVRVLSGSLSPTSRARIFLSSNQIIIFCIPSKVSTVISVNAGKSKHSSMRMRFFTAPEVLSISYFQLLERFMWYFLENWSNVVVIGRATSASCAACCVPSLRRTHAGK